MIYKILTVDGRHIWVTDNVLCAMCDGTPLDKQPIVHRTLDLYAFNQEYGHA